MVLFVLPLHINLLVSSRTLVIAFLYVFSLLTWLAEGPTFIVFSSCYICVLISSIYFYRSERAVLVSLSIFFSNSWYISSLRMARLMYF